MRGERLADVPVATCRTSDVSIKPVQIRFAKAPRYRLAPTLQGGEIALHGRRFARSRVRGELLQANRMGTWGLGSG